MYCMFPQIISQKYFGPYRRWVLNISSGIGVFLFFVPSPGLDHLLLLCVEGSEIHRKGETEKTNPDSEMLTSLIFYFYFLT